MKKNICLIFGLIAVFLTSSCTNEADYETWDANSDDRIDDQEFYDTSDQFGYYDTWDDDADGTINEEEWNTGVTTYYGDYDANTYGTFTDWDADADGFLREDEFNDWTYDMWDEDESGFIEATEYETWYYPI